MRREVKERRTEEEYEERKSRFYNERVLRKELVEISMAGERVRTIKDNTISQRRYLLSYQFSSD